MELIYWHLSMDEYQKLTKILGKLQILLKNAKIREKNFKNHSIVTRNYAVPY